MLAAMVRFRALISALMALGLPIFRFCDIVLITLDCLFKVYLTYDNQSYLKM